MPWRPSLREAGPSGPRPFDDDARAEPDEGRGVNDRRRRQLTVAELSACRLGSAPDFDRRASSGRDPRPDEPAEILAYRTSYRTSRAAPGPRADLPRRRAGAELARGSDRGHGERGDRAPRAAESLGEVARPRLRPSLQRAGRRRALLARPSARRAVARTAVRAVQPTLARRERVSAVVTDLAARPNVNVVDLFDPSTRRASLNAREGSHSRTDLTDRHMDPVVITDLPDVLWPVIGAGNAAIANWAIRRQVGSPGTFTFGGYLRIGMQRVRNAHREAAGPEVHRPVRPSCVARAGVRTSARGSVRSSCKHSKGRFFMGP